VSSPLDGIDGGERKALKEGEIASEKTCQKNDERKDQRARRWQTELPPGVKLKGRQQNREREIAKHRRGNKNQGRGTPVRGVSGHSW